LILNSWDKIYDRELQNYGDDEDDEGTVWFSESNAEEAVLKQLVKLHDAGLLRRSNHPNDSNLDSPASRFLDLGTGNGHMLFELCESDDEDLRWDGELVGVDYSEGSVQLARRIAEQKRADHHLGTRIRFERWDLLQERPGDWLSNGFDVVLDKGTFDAISLMAHDNAPEHPCQIYREKVTPLIKPGGFLFVTSCNWTKQELLQWLVPDKRDLIYFDEAKYPTFSFGGQTGQTIVTIVFRRTER
jgi:SAM-dependent methyltransferase